jgi:hypothetical protein
MMFVLMKKLVVALTKLAVNTTVPEPGTTVMTCLIDFVSAQENATQAALMRIEGKIDDIHQNPFRLGRRILMDANKINNNQLKMERIQRALDAFTQASQYSRISDPLIPLKAKLSAGACYDLLHEGAAALDNYEEVFREAKEFEKIARQGTLKSEGFDLLDALDNWIESRKPDYKERQQLVEALVNSKTELGDFIENLLQLILNRKGMSREEYLKPWTPAKKKVKKPHTPSLTARLQNDPLSFNLTQKKFPRFGTTNFMTCPTCGQVKTYDTCPVCHGLKKTGYVTCARCFGIGKTFICACDKPVISNSHRPVGLDLNRCLFCGGKGKISRDRGKTWVTCIMCHGTGRSKY